MEDHKPPPVPDHHTSRLDLVWDTVVFQFKLVADGLRDLLLSPISIIATIAGLVSGGAQPDRYFRQVQQLGRRSERWINLFGRYRRGDTADTLLEPIEARLKDEYARGGWVTRSADQVNSLLDSLNTNRPQNDPPPPDHPPEQSPRSTAPPSGSSVKDDSKSP